MLSQPTTPFDHSLAQKIDHTLLKPEASQAQVNQLCQEAIAYSFWSVCINPFWVPLAVKLLQGSPVKIATVIGFPLGANSTTTKALEAGEAICHGANELDMVINIGALKSGEFNLVEQDIKAVVRIAAKRALVKVILETCLLTEAEKIHASQICLAVGADFLKTSTGFGPHGATVEDVALLKREAGSKIRVKAAGGIRDFDTALAMLKAGADRIGTSAGVKIVTTNSKTDS